MTWQQQLAEMATDYEQEAINNTLDKGIIMSIENDLISITNEVKEMEERTRRVELCASFLEKHITKDQIIFPNPSGKVSDHCLVQQLLDAIRE